MIDNTSLLNDLITRGLVRINNDNLLQTTPVTLPSVFDFTKVEGMLLGAVIGDSLGATSEGMLPSERHKQYGEIRDYIPGRRSKYKPVGVPTDDTQLTFWTLKQLISDEGLVPDNLAGRFCKHHIRGIGNTTKQFISNYKDHKIPWYKSGLDSLGNGVLMRISPIVVPYLKNPHPSMYADAALDTMITHNNFANISACVSFVNILWSLLAMKSVPDPHWWINSYCSVAEKLEGMTQYTPRIPQYTSFRGSLWQFTHKVVSDALHRRLSVLEACQDWGSGANLFETVPSVIYILAKHAQNPEEAIIRAVNDTKDNDTVAAIVGAAIGALYGLDGIPDTWIQGLTGRTKEEDDGAVFKLIFRAKKAFWSG